MKKKARAKSSRPHNTAESISPGNTNLQSSDMTASALETACRLYQQEAKTNPFDTWLIVENEDIRRRAVELIDSPVLQTRITTVRTLAQTILAEQNSGIRIIPPEEQYLLFSLFSKNLFDKTAAKTITENLIDLYTTITLSNVACPTDTEKGRKAAEVFSRYRHWCEEHAAVDANTAIKTAMPFAKQMKPSACICFALKSIAPAAEDLLAAFTKNPLTIEPEFSEAEAGRIIAYKNSREEIAQTLDAICTLEEQGVPGSDILLLTPTLKAALPLIEEVAAGFYVNRTTPLTFKTAERKSIQNIPAIRAVLSFVTAAYKAEETDLAAILECPYLRINRRRVTAGILRKAVKMTGSSDWRNIQTGEDETLKNVLSEILDRAETRQRAARTLQERITALKEDLDELGWTYAEMTKTEDAARREFFNLLDRFAAAGTAENTCRAAEFAAILSRGCRKHAGIRYPENETAFRLGKLRSAAGTKTPYVFIIGLSAKSIPNISATLPLLTVQETKALQPDRYRKAAADTAYYFEAACASAEKELVLSYAESDGGNSFAPSPYLTRRGEPEKAAVQNPTHAVSGCQKTLGKRIAGGENITEAFGIRDINETAYKISSAEPALVFDEERFTAIYEEKKTFSPSFLETYADCPVAWYFKHHLKLEDPADSHNERKKIGTVMHKVFERFFRTHECITEETEEEAYEELVRLTAEEMEKTGITTPSWKALELGYLGCDAAESALKKIIREEVCFAREGYRTDPRWLEADVAGEIAGITVAGRADRVMQKENGVFKVLDYKTGNLKYIAADALQLPLYTEAVRQMTDGTPTAGQYLPIGVDNANTARKITANAEELIEAATGKTEGILAGIKSGSFRHTENCSGYCPYSHICRKAEGGEDD